MKPSEICNYTLYFVETFDRDQFFYDNFIYGELRHVNIFNCADENIFLILAVIISSTHSVYFSTFYKHCLQKSYYLLYLPIKLLFKLLPLVMPLFYYVLFLKINEFCEISLNLVSFYSCLLHIFIYNINMMQLE